MYVQRDTFLHFNKMVHTNTGNIKYISYSILLQYIHLVLSLRMLFLTTGAMIVESGVSMQKSE